MKEINSVPETTEKTYEPESFFILQNISIEFHSDLHLQRGNSNVLHFYHKLIYRKLELVFTLSPSL